MNIHGQTVVITRGASGLATVTPLEADGERAVASDREGAIRMALR